MDHFAGLDVSVKETSICIVDDAGKIVREADISSPGINNHAPNWMPHFAPQVTHVVTVAQVGLVRRAERLRAHV